MPLLHKVWLLGILHAWISQHSIKCPHRDLQWLEGNLSTQADLALHLSSPPFPLLTFLTSWGENLGVGGSRGRIYWESKLQVLCQPKGFLLQGCVFLLCSWEMGTLGLISCHNKGCSGTLLKPDAVVGQSRAVS